MTGPTRFVQTGEMSMQGCYKQSIITTNCWFLKISPFVGFHVSWVSDLVSDHTDPLITHLIEVNVSMPRMKYHQTRKKSFTCFDRKLSKELLDWQNLNILMEARCQDVTYEILLVHEVREETTDDVLHYSLMMITCSLMDHQPLSA